MIHLTLYKNFLCRIKKIFSRKNKNFAFRCPPRARYLRQVDRLCDQASKFLTFMKIKLKNDEASKDVDW